MATKSAFGAAESLQQAARLRNTSAADEPPGDPGFPDRARRAPRVPGAGQQRQPPLIGFGDCRLSLADFNVADAAY